MSGLEDRVEEGLRAHRAGDLVAARRLYAAVLEAAPDHARALRLLGVLCWGEGDPGGALGWLDRAAVLAPDDVAIARARGAALLAAGRLDEAAAAFSKALELEPGDAETLDNLALVESRRAPAPVHLMIGTPCFGGNVTDHYTISLLKLQAACLERGLKLSFCLLHGDALITRARNSVVAEFLRDESATHLLFIDADIGFRPAQVFRLLEADKDMAAAVYPVKRLDWPRVGRSLRAGDDDPPEGALDYVVEFADPEGRPAPGPVAPENGFARARYAGTGFLLVRRPVFERMAAHHPEIKYRRSHATADADVSPDLLHAFFDCRIDPATGHYLSEDFTFCQRWTGMGGEIWIDLRSRLTHIGRLAFEGNLTNRYRHLLPGGSGAG